MVRFRPVGLASRDAREAATHLATRSRPSHDIHGARRTVVVAAGIGAIIGAVSFPFLGAIAIALCALFAASLVPWRLTTFGCPADPQRLVVPYLLALIVFMIHVGEEYLSAIWEAFSRIGQPITERTFFLTAAVAAPMFWLLGLILL